MPRSKIKNLIIILIIGFILYPAIGHAAVLYLEPAEGSYYQNDTFIVEVGIDTQGEEINAVSAGLAFDQNLLKVIDFSQGDSAVRLWAEQPNVQTGGIFFIGGMPQGFNGRGRILRIIFQGKKGGESGINFTANSQVLLNDGLGTVAKFTAKGAAIAVLPGQSEITANAWQKELAGDKTAPEPFEIEIGRDLSIFEGKYFISFSAADKQTGIDYYEIKEGEGDWARGQSPYVLQDQDLKSKISVKAVDKAGNERIAEATPPKNRLLNLFILILAGAAILYWLIKKFRRR